MHYTPRMSLTARICVPLILTILSNSAAAVDTQWLDRPLQDYIAWLIQQDFAIIYSSDLVLPEYTVLAEPDIADSVAALREILEPYRLSLADGPGDSLLIVRQDNSFGSIALTVTELSTNESVADAALLLQAAVEVHERKFGPSHRSTLIVVYNLGELYAEQELHEEALPHFERAAVAVAIRPPRAEWP